MFGRESKKESGHLIWRGLKEGLISDQGATAIMVAVLSIALLELTAVVVDAGALYSERRQIQTGADAAALAGVQELPGDPAAAVAVAEQYASANAVEATDVSFVVQGTYSANDTLVARMQDPDFGLFFARFLGMNEAPVGAQATAVIASPTSFGRGVMPFGIMSAEPSGAAEFGYPFNTLVTLKKSAANVHAGNFQFLNLTSQRGKRVILTALEDGGVDEPVYSDTLYDTEPGLDGGNVPDALRKWVDAGHKYCSFEDVVELDADGMVNILDYECHRLIVCPIIVKPGDPVQYSWEEVHGRSEPILVIGFAYFYIDEIGPKGGKDCYVTGRFIRPLGDDDDVQDWGQVDPHGAIAFKLID